MLTNIVSIVIRGMKFVEEFYGTIRGVLLWKEVLVSAGLVCEAAAQALVALHERWMALISLQNCVQMLHSGPE